MSCNIQFAYASSGEENNGDRFLPDLEKINMIDASQKGSLTVQLSEGKKSTSRENIRFDCIKVAELINGEYKLAKEYESLDVDLNTIETAGALKTATEKIVSVKETKILASAKTNSNGVAVFDGLDVGVYAVIPENTETFDEIETSIVALPSWSETDDLMHYDLRIEPKHSPRPEIPEKTIPQTGLMEKTGFYILGSIVCMIAAGILIFTKRER